MRLLFVGIPRELYVCAFSRYSSSGCEFLGLDGCAHVASVEDVSVIGGHLSLAQLSIASVASRALLDPTSDPVVRLFSPALPLDTSSAPAIGGLNHNQGSNICRSKARPHRSVGRCRSESANSQRSDSSDLLLELDRLAKDWDQRGEEEKSAGMANSSEKQAEAAKKQGNIYFKKEKLGAAIEAYTEAIALCPQVPVYWTNRALCERKRNEWEKVEADCRKALELDNKSVKGHYMLGLALLHHQQYGRAVAELEKALDLGRGVTAGTSYMVEEIWQELAKARYTQWEDSATARRQQQNQLQSYLHHLLYLDNQSKLKEITSVMTPFEFLDPSSEQLQDWRDCKPQEGEERIRLPTTDEDEGSSGLGEEHCGAPGVEVDGRRDGGSLYPPIYGQTEEHEHEHEQADEHKHEQQQEVEEEAEERTCELAGEEGGKRVEGTSGNHGIGESKPERRRSTEPARFDPLNNKFSLQRRKSLQLRVDKLLKTAAEDETKAASSSSRSWDEDKTSYTIYDVFKVFKEMVRLQQGKAGQELLRTTELYERRSKALDDLFDKVAAPDISGEVPDHLCCTITMEIFRDPVMTPSGITYERAALNEHLKKVGHFDPISRAPLSPQQIFPNLAVRDAVQSFLAEHGWAYRT